MELLARMRRDLHAFGVPRVAWLQRLPRIYHSYTVRLRSPHWREGLNGIQVWTAPEQYYVRSPPSSSNGAPVAWNGHAAGECLAGWE